MLFPLAARAQTEPIDVTATFRSAGVDIKDLQVFAISGIVLIRGTSPDAAKAAQAGVVARNLGYQRVANLIDITEPSNDGAIVRSAERRLSQRGLDGCKFHIDSINGIVHVSGSVQEELQKDVVVDLLRHLDGVKEVHSTLSVL